jgi:hypothetical protein
MDILGEAINLGINLVEKWSLTGTLLPEIGFPKLNLMKPLIYPSRRVRIWVIWVGKLVSDFSKFEALKSRELDNMKLSQVRRIGTFRLFTIRISAMPASFSQRSPKLSQHP